MKPIAIANIHPKTHGDRFPLRSDSHAIRMDNAAAVTYIGLQGEERFVNRERLPNRESAVTYIVRS